jgi:hypothetical protein
VGVIVGTISPTNEGVQGVVAREIAFEQSGPLVYPTA